MSKSVAVYGILERLVPRKTLWRLGRFLYLGARRELKNHPEINGEYNLLRDMIARNSDKTSATVCDIGANFGHWSIEAMKAGTQHGVSLAVHLFEPAPDQRQRLEDNLAKQDCAGHTTLAHSAALADKEGELPFVITGSESGNSALVAGEVDEDLAVIKVPVATLDATIAEHNVGPILLAKVDTEGNDFNVLLGAQDAMARKAITAIQIEYNWRWIEFGHFLKKVFDLVTPLGYCVGKITGRGVEYYEEWHPELDRMIETNFVIVDREKLAMVPGTHYRFTKANVPQAVGAAP